jgi:hypothetical protein
MQLVSTAAFSASGFLNQICTPSSAYTGSTSLLPVVGADFTTVASVTNGTQTISFSPSLRTQTVPNGGWATWNAPPATESATPRVLRTVGSSTATLTLAVPANTFGFEIEPDLFGVHTVTANFYGGNVLIGVVSLTVEGNSGALIAGGSDNTLITSVVITVPGTDFAIAQLRYGGFNLSTPFCGYNNFILQWRFGLLRDSERPGHRVLRNTLFDAEIAEVRRDRR